MRDRTLILLGLSLILAQPSWAANIKFRSGQSRGQSVVRARNARAMVFRAHTVQRAAPAPPAASAPEAKTGADAGEGEAPVPAVDAAPARAGKVHPRRNYGYTAPSAPTAGAPMVSIADEFLSRVAAKHRRQAREHRRTASLRGELGGGTSAPSPSSFNVIQIPGAAPVGTHNRDQGGKPQGTHNRDQGGRPAVPRRGPSSR